MAVRLRRLLRVLSELDLSVTGSSSYHDYVRAYVVPHIGHLQMHTLADESQARRAVAEADDPTAGGL